MKMEDHFKETLRRAAANEPPVLDAWDRFERRLGRSRRWALIASIAGTAAVIVAAVLIVPKLGTGGVRVIPPATQPTSNPSITVSPSPTVSPGGSTPLICQMQPCKSFENLDKHFRLSYPAEWRTSAFEAVDEFNPPGLDSTDGKGPDGSFGVVVNVLEASSLDDKLASKPGAGPSGRASDTEETRDGSVLYVRHRIDWSASRCITLGTTCPEGDELYLIVTIQGEDTAELMGKYREIGELIVASLEYVP